MKKIIKTIPNGITLINLSLGFSAILVNDPFISPLLILLASLADGFDGLMARILDARSALGEQLDSLSDLVSFGVAPAFIYYQQCMQGNWWEIVIICLFPSFAALRLAIFNLDNSQHNTFRGLPSPSAGLFLAFVVFAWTDWLKSFDATWIIVVLPLIPSFLMLSKVRMFSLKNPLKQTALRKVLFIILGTGTLVLFGLMQLESIPLIIMLYVLLSICEDIIIRVRLFNQA